jgi:hypothetical protein
LRKVENQAAAGNFTGVDEIIVAQGFCISMPGGSLCPFGAAGANEIIENRESADRIHDHKANTNVLIGIFCNVIPKCMLCNSKGQMVKMLAEAIIFSSKNKIPIRPDRHFEHKAKHHSQHVQTIKSAV